jgi:hypothetical protein
LPRHEPDRIHERIGQVKADQKARGRYLGGKVPFGSSINDAEQAVGYSSDVNGVFLDATEWSGGKIVNLGGLPGSLIALPPASTTAVRRWDIVLTSMGYCQTARSGAAAASSSWEASDLSRGHFGHIQVRPKQMGLESARRRKSV